VAAPPADDDVKQKAIAKAKQNLDGAGVLAALIPDGDPITQW